MENLLKQDSTLTLEGPLQEEARPAYKDDYASSLRAHGITNYTESEHYYHVDEPKMAQGWLLHITVIPAQMEPLLDRILPVLNEYQSSFKIVKNRSLHKSLNGGVFGRFKIGKVITVFLDDDTIITPLIQQLIRLTATDFTGPQVITDFYISNILFTRYGSFVTQVQTDAWGNRVRIIQDGAGRFFLDKYYTPPVVPPGISNPFVSVVQPRPAPPKVYLIGGKYMPVRLLKSDDKGNVWKALYFNKFLIPKWCVVKEGRKGMFPDNDGRDIRNKLSWQYQVGKSLASSIPVPKTLDYIENPVTGHVYFVMQYIRKAGVIWQAIFSKLKTDAWFAQPLSIQLEVLDYMLQIIKGIQQLHQQGYLHRDITGNNFLVNHHKKVYLIDLELAWSMQDQLPDPPFGLGTPGYMSPEQAAGHAPSPADDSYSIGALLSITFTTGIKPTVLIDDSPGILAQKLFFWTGDWRPVKMVTSCLASVPEERPDINTIYTSLSDYIAALRNTIPSPISQPPVMYDGARIKETIEQAITGLSGELMTHDHLWFSPVGNNYGWDVYPLGDKHVFGALHRGIGGVLYLLGRAQEMGFSIQAAKENIQAGLEFINNELISSMGIEDMVPSLHYGRAGLAVTLATSLKNGFLPDTPYYRNAIRNCFLQPAVGYDMIYGLAGQGMGALQCAAYIEADTLRDITTSYALILLQAQEKDGSWSKPGNQPNIREKDTSFGYGIAGIMYFLLEYGNRYQHTASLSAAKKGLQYLTKQAKYTQGRYKWHNSDRDKSIGLWWCKGAPGIALSFLKAYEFTQDPLFLDIAEKALLVHPKYPVFPTLGQCHGLSGLGEIYLEAYRVTRNNEWWERADWIANELITLSRITEKGEAYWGVETSNLITADFMIGNSGVIHFLLRFYHPDKLRFPFL